MAKVVKVFEIPTDREEAARMAAFFWARVHFQNIKSNTSCWLHDPDIRKFQYDRLKVKYVASPQRAAWAFVTGEVLGPRDYVKPRCGASNCVRPAHQHVIRRAELIDSVRELRARWMSTAAIAKTWDCSWTLIGDLLRGAIVRETLPYLRSFDVVA